MSWCRPSFQVNRIYWVWMGKLSCLQSKQERSKEREIVSLMQYWLKWHHNTYIYNPNRIMQPILSVLHMYTGILLPVPGWRYWTIAHCKNILQNFLILEQKAYKKKNNGSTNTNCWGTPPPITSGSAFLPLDVASAAGCWDADTIAGSWVPINIFEPWLAGRILPHCVVGVGDAALHS